MTVLLPLLAFAMVLGFTLCLVGFIENRRERELVVIDVHRENIRRALAASRRYTGRAWTQSDISLVAANEAGASRVSGAVKVDLRDPLQPVKVDRSRNLSGQSSRRVPGSATSTRLSLAAPPRQGDLAGHNARTPPRQMERRP